MSMPLPQLSALKQLGLRQEDFLIQCDQELSLAQRQTSNCFGFKWSKRDTYESEAMQKHARQWLIERYLNGDPSVLDKWFKGGDRIVLDAGCGAGYSALLFFGDKLKENHYLGVDISEAVDVARQRFAQAGIPGEFARGDIMRLPIPENSLDMIYSEGVLHHTDDTGEAVRRLTRKLKSGGRFLFYVYKKKAVIREYTDDHIRCALKNLSDENAWQALEPLTRLGQILGKLDVNIEIPEDIPLLGIKKGSNSLHRFFYYSICKLFYRPELSFDEMNHINFDWFRPLNCRRHTIEEVKEFCRASGMDIERLHVDDSGITIVGIKKKFPNE
ncbi:MAG: class I SAM-dependent methyltransferase [Desulfobacterales bacterium]|nr:class I SAM-dependent methyltransferase [Desulfobacterales bacterium]